MLSAMQPRQNHAFAPSEPLRFLNGAIYKTVVFLGFVFKTDIKPFCATSFPFGRV
jgi:hypothetical protein